MSCTISDSQLAGIAFTGGTLGPFFSYDPKLDGAKLLPAAQAICELDVPSAAEAWPFVDAPLAADCLSRMQEGLADGLDAPALVDEYRRLFVGPAAKVAPPWGSVYTDKDMVVFGASTLALKAWLRCHGVSVAKGESDEPEDHIGTMLSLMGWLAQNKPDALCEYLQSHLLTWAGHFLGIVEAESAHPFYRGLAALTGRTLDGIQGELGLEVETPRFYR